MQEFTIKCHKQIITIGSKLILETINQKPDIVMQLMNIRKSNRFNVKHVKKSMALDLLLLHLDKYLFECSILGMLMFCLTQNLSQTGFL